MHDDSDAGKGIKFEVDYWEENVDEKLQFSGIQKYMKILINLDQFIKEKDNQGVSKLSDKDVEYLLVFDRSHFENLLDLLLSVKNEIPNVASDSSLSGSNLKNFKLKHYKIIEYYQRIVTSTSSKLDRMIKSMNSVTEEKEVATVSFDNILGNDQLLLKLYDVSAAGFDHFEIAYWYEKTYGANKDDDKYLILKYIKDTALSPDEKSYVSSKMLSALSKHDDIGNVINIGYSNRATATAEYYDEETTVGKDTWSSIDSQVRKSMKDNPYSKLTRSEDMAAMVSLAKELGIETQMVTIKVKT